MLTTQSSWRPDRIRTRPANCAHACVRLPARTKEDTLNSATLEPQQVTAPNPAADPQPDQQPPSLHHHRHGDRDRSQDRPAHVEGRALCRLQRLRLAEGAPGRRGFRHPHPSAGQGDSARARGSRHPRNRLHRHRQNAQLPDPDDRAHGRQLRAFVQGQARPHPLAHPAAHARARHAGARGLRQDFAAGQVRLRAGVRRL